MRLPSPRLSPLQRAALLGAALGSTIVLAVARDAPPATSPPTPGIPAAAHAGSSGARNAAALARFRENLPEVTALDGGAMASRNALVAGFVRAIERHDTLALRHMVLSRAEFAWLYYPTTPYTRAPQELEAGLVWFLMQQNGEKGVGRVVDRYGGRPFGYTSYTCAAPRTQGALRIWDGCRLRFRPAGTDSLLERRLFGSILEHQGRFKLVSYANDL